MPHKFNPANCTLLESPERLALLPVEKALALVEVKAGEWVLDIGCGTGVFTVPLARAVGESGQIFAADLQTEMVEEDPPAFLAEIRRVLRPTGRLAVVEWEKVETGGGNRCHTHRPMG